MLPFYTYSEVYTIFGTVSKKSSIKSTDSIASNNSSIIVLLLVRNYNYTDIKLLIDIHDVLVLLVMFQQCLFPPFCQSENLVGNKYAV